MTPNWHYNVQNDTYWCEEPGNLSRRWHVSQKEANTFGTVAGQIIKEAGWYYYCVDYANGSGRGTESVGPFTSANAAIANCQTAFKRIRS